MKNLHQYISLSNEKISSIDDYIHEKLVLSKTKYKRPEDEYFYHEALEDGYCTKFKETKKVLQYSIDNCQTWYNLEPDTESTRINKGERIYFKGENMKIDGDCGIGTFKSNKKFNVGGNIMSLIYGDKFEYKTELLEHIQFCMLFYGNIKLISAKDLVLPIIELTKDCYNSMFCKCKSLIEAPELPATKLADYCYSHMFYCCESLTTAPELPATELVKDCYRGMFAGCTALTKASELPATKLADYCYFNMFGGCASLTKAPELPATKLAKKCYTEMFSDCTSLTEAPVLPATKLTKECYSGMFGRCTLLNEITMLATDMSASDCLRWWVSNVSKTGTFNKAKNIDIQISAYDNDYSGIPKGWTVKEI